MTTEARASGKRTKKDPPAFAVTVDAQEFAAALAQAARGAGRRNMEILGGVKIEASSDALGLTATDMEVVMRARCGAQVAGPGAVVLADAKGAAALVKGLSGPLSIEQEPDAEGVVLVSWTGARYRVATLEVADFPAVPEMTGPRGVIERAAFVETFAHVANVYSRDESRPVLCGVFASMGADGALRLVATDSYRLAVKTTAGACEGDGFEDIVPGRALAEVLRLAKRKGAGALIEWVANDSRPSSAHIAFSLDGAQVLVRLFGGQYPDYTRLRPDSFEVDYDLVSAEVAAAAKRLERFAGGEHPVVALSVDAGTGAASLALSTSYIDASETLPTPAGIAYRPQVGRGKAMVPAGGPVGPIGFNPTFLQEAVRSCGEIAHVRLLGALRAAVFTGEDADAWHLLMPIRLAG